MTDARDIDCPKCAKSGDDCGEHSPSWEELVDYWRNEAASLRKQLEDAREALRCLAEGNLGPNAWQADYAKIKEVAREALKGQPC